MVLATWNTALRVYEITAKATKGTLTLDLLPPGQTQFTDAVPDHGRYWALAEGKFVSFRPTSNGQYEVNLVELESKECIGLNKY